MGITHKLNEQWVENGRMLKKVAHPEEDCNGCTYHKNGMCAKAIVGCGEIIIKDLGPVNKDGFLPCPWNEKQYPEILTFSEEWSGKVYEYYIMEREYVEGKHLIKEEVRCYYVNAGTLKELRERWNRR